MRVTTKRFISIMFGMVLTASAIFIYGLLIAPTVDEINALRVEVAKKENLYEAQREAVEKVKSLFSQTQQNVRLQETLGLVLPVADPIISGSVAQLNGIAIFNAVTLNQLSIQLGPIQPPPKDVPFASGIGTVKLSFEITGSYESIKKFLETVETNVRLMDVVQLNMDEVVQDRNILRARLSVDAYYQAKAPQSRTLTTPQ